MQRTPNLGETVAYVLPHRYRNAGQTRAAFVCRVSDAAALRLNLKILTDGLNDGVDRDLVWETSVPYDTDGAPGTWHPFPTDPITTFLGGVF